MRTKSLPRSVVVIFAVIAIPASVLAAPGGMYMGDETPVHPHTQAGDTAYVGDPISVYNGNNVQSQEDILCPTPHHRGFVFERSYNSQSEGMGLLGYGWTHSFDVHLNPSYRFERQTYLKIEDETGRGVYFLDGGGGRYVGTFKEASTVTKEGEGYVWHRLDGSRFVFDGRHLLTRIEDGVGNCQYLTYDEKGCLQAIADGAINHIFTLHYNAQGLLEYISSKGEEGTPNVVWVFFGYDTHQNLVSATYPDGSGFQYRYTDPRDVHNLTEKRDKTGKFLSSWSYDNQDRATENVTHDHKGVRIEYVNDNEVTVTDAHGVTRIYSIWAIDGRKVVTRIDGAPGHERAPDEIRGISYDRHRRITEVRYVGGVVTQYDDFDSHGNARTVKHLLVAEGQIEVEKIEKCVYHPNINVKIQETELSPAGEKRKVIIWDYDDDGNEIPNENPMGKPRRRMEWGLRPDGSGSMVPYESVTDYTFDEYGRLLSVDEYGSSDSDPKVLRYDDYTFNIFSGQLAAGI